ncbi:uncharacterized protein G2W53_032983 [Senna tora]|uniref:Uncharacterized protein n=1 Tax=Senna tora TaxID=362788 RepID=A0A834SZ73_9FABA|nr:uncharacterized protein G2W53_032983 [Senna tora]
MGIAILNDFKRVEGDRALGLQSLPIAFNTETAKWICVGSIDITQLSVAALTFDQTLTLAVPSLTVTAPLQLVSTHESRDVGVGQEYDKISGCDTAKQMCDKLQVTNEGTSKVKEIKINMLVHEYKLFMKKKNERIDDMFNKFLKILGDLKALERPYSDREQVRKFLRSLPKLWKSKVDTIESGNIDSLTFDELRGILIAYERTYLKRYEQEDKKKNVPFKSSSSFERCEEDDDEEGELDEQHFAFFTKKMENYARRKKQLWKQHHSQFTKKGSKSEQDDDAQEEELEQEMANFCFMAQEEPEVTITPEIDNTPTKEDLQDALDEESNDFQILLEKIELMEKIIDLLGTEDIPKLPYVSKDWYMTCKKSFIIIDYSSKSRLNNFKHVFFYVLDQQHVALLFFLQIDPLVDDEDTLKTFSKIPSFSNQDVVEGGDVAWVQYKIIDHSPRIFHFIDFVVDHFKCLYEKMHGDDDNHNNLARGLIVCERQDHDIIKMITTPNRNPFRVRKMFEFLPTLGII